MITTHYLDQYPFGCEDFAQRRRDGLALICTPTPLSPPSTTLQQKGGEPVGAPEGGSAAASISLHGDKWKRRELWVDGVQGLRQGTGEGRGRGDRRRGTRGGSGGWSLPRVLCGRNNMSSWPENAGGEAACHGRKQIPRLSSKR